MSAGNLERLVTSIFSRNTNLFFTYQNVDYKYLSKYDPIFLNPNFINEIMRQLYLGCKFEQILTLEQTWKNILIDENICSGKIIEIFSLLRGNI